MRPSNMFTAWTKCIFLVWKLPDMPKQNINSQMRSKFNKMLAVIFNYEDAVLSRFPLQGEIVKSIGTHLVTSSVLRIFLTINITRTVFLSVKHFLSRQVIKQKSSRKCLSRQPITRMLNTFMRLIY